MGQITEFSSGLNAGSRPEGGIVTGSDGNLWFTALGAPSAIGRITPSGTITQFNAGLNAGSIPWNIATGPDGNLWFTDEGTTQEEESPWEVQVRKGQDEEEEETAAEVTQAKATWRPALLPLLA